MELSGGRREFDLKLGEALVGEIITARIGDVAIRGRVTGVSTNDSYGFVRIQGYNLADGTIFDERLFDIWAIEVCE